MLFFVCSLPVVKEWLAKIASDSISNTIGSKVSMSTVSLNLFNSISVDSLVIYDQHQIKMIAVDRIGATVEISSLLKGKCTLSNLKLLKGTVNVYKEEVDSPLNCQFLIDCLSPHKDQKSGIELSLKSIVAKQFNLEYNITNEPHIKGFIDKNHLEFKNIDCSVILHTNNKDDYNIRIRNLCFDAKGGLKLRKTNALISYREKSSMIDFNIRKMAFVYDKYFANINGTTLRLNSSEFGDNYLRSLYFLKLRTTISDGYANKYRVLVDAFSHNKGGRYPLLIKLQLFHDNNKVVDLNCNSSYRPLNDFRLHYNLLLNKSDLLSLLNFSGLNKNDNTVLSHFSLFRQSGNVDILNKRIKLDGELLSDIGQAVYNVGMRDSLFYLNLCLNNVDATPLKLKRNVSFSNANIKGTAIIRYNDIYNLVKQGAGQLLNKIKFSIVANVSKLKISTISIDKLGGSFSYKNGLLTSDLKVDDSKTKFEGNVKCSLSKVCKMLHISIPDYYYKSNNFLCAKGHVDYFHTSLLDNAFGVVKSLSINNFDAQLVDDDNFKIVLNDYSYIDDNNNGSSLMNGSLECKNTNGVRVYNLLAENCQGQLETNMNLPEIVSGFSNQLLNHYHLAKHNFGKSDVLNSSGYAHLNLKVSKGSLISCLADYYGFAISSPVDIHANLSVPDGSSMFTAILPNVAVKGHVLTNASVYLSNREDSLKGSLMFTKMFGNNPVRIESLFKGKDNFFYNELTWKDILNTNTYGRISTKSTFRYNENGYLCCDTYVLPSDMYIKDTLWAISPSNISICKDNVSVDKFRVFHKNQFVNLNANISNIHKIVLVDLNDIEISYLLSLVGFKPVEFSGRATGVLRNTENDNLTANLFVKDFCFNTGPMGDLKLMCLYDNVENKINIDAKSQYSPTDSTLITGGVDVKNNSLDINIKSEKTNLQFLNKYVKSFISDLEGNTTGDFRLFGDLSHLNMEGRHCINYMKFRPKILGVLYTFEGDSLCIRPDTIDFSGMILRDSYGNSAKIKGSLNHHSLYDFDYNVDFSLDNLMVLNWKEEMGKSFWGQIFTSGIVGISGDFDKVNLKGELATSGNHGTSILNYNTETTSSTGDEKDYVRFVTRSQRDCLRVNNTIQKKTDRKR